jgi:polyhydroxyalkanoate synthesis regulator phasin
VIVFINIFMSRRYMTLQFASAGRYTTIRQGALDWHGYFPIFQPPVERIKMKLSTTLAMIAVTAFSNLAFAQTPTPSDKAGARIDARQAEQQKRIDAGVKSGELTQKEAARLQKGQERIQKMEDKARADGKITKAEARRIEHAQDHQSKNIYREKHDKQKAK